MYDGKLPTIATVCCPYTDNAAVCGASVHFRQERQSKKTRTTENGTRFLKFLVAKRPNHTTASSHCSLNILVQNSSKEKNPKRHLVSLPPYAKLATLARASFLILFLNGLIIIQAHKSRYDQIMINSYKVTQTYAKRLKSVREKKFIEKTTAEQINFVKEFVKWRRRKRKSRQEWLLNEKFSFNVLLICFHPQLGSDACRLKMFHFRSGVDWTTD